MVERAPDFVAVTPLGDFEPFTRGAGDGVGVNLSVQPARAMVQLFARNGKADDVAKNLKLEARPGQATICKNFVTFPLSSGQWLLVSNADDPEKFAPAIEKKISGIGYISEQSDARICIRVSGLKARDLMSRGCRLDLHESVISKGFCAQTQMAQVGVLIHQVDDAPIYDLYVYAGFAKPFWQWLIDISSQFGISAENKGE